MGCTLIPMSNIKHERPRARLNPTAITTAIKLRVPPPELEIIRAAAERDGLTMSAYFRNAALGTASLEAEQREQVLTAGSAQPDPRQQVFIDLKDDDDPAENIYAREKIKM